MLWPPQWHLPPPGTESLDPPSLHLLILTFSDYCTWECEKGKTTHLTHGKACKILIVFKIQLLLYQMNHCKPAFICDVLLSRYLSQVPVRNVLFLHETLTFTCFMCKYMLKILSWTIVLVNITKIKRSPIKWLWILQLWHYDIKTTVLYKCRPMIMVIDSAFIKWLHFSCKRWEHYHSQCGHFYKCTIISMCQYLNINCTPKLMY